MQADESEGVLVFETSGVFALENVRAATSTAPTSGVPSVLVALCVRKHSMQVRPGLSPFGRSCFSCTRSLPQPPPLCVHRNAAFRCCAGVTELMHVRGAHERVASFCHRACVLEGVLASVRSSGQTAPTRASVALPSTRSASHRMLQLRAYQRDVLPQWRELWRELSIPSASVGPASEPCSHLLSVPPLLFDRFRRDACWPAQCAHAHRRAHCMHWYHIIVLILAILRRALRDGAAAAYSLAAQRQGGLSERTQTVARFTELAVSLSATAI